MITSRQIRRAQRLLLLVACSLTIYFWAVYRVIDQRSTALHAPLAQAWKKLGTAQVASGGDKTPDVTKMDVRLRQTQKALNRLLQAEQTIARQLTLDTTIRAKMNEPFQLIDFQIEEQYRIEKLSALASQNGVALSSSIFSAFPEYTAEKSEPEFLWAQLFFLDYLLTTAVECKVTTIRNIDVPPVASHQVSPTNLPYLYEIPVGIEVVGSMDAVSKLMAKIPKMETTAERPAKPILYVHRFILKKNSAENPNETLLDLKASGFVHPER